MAHDELINGTVKKEFKKIRYISNYVTSKMKIGVKHPYFPLSPHQTIFTVGCRQIIV